MPQASSAQRRAWGIAPDKAQRVLVDAGFALGADFVWRRATPPTDREWSAIAFLVDEWDFGGFRALPPMLDVEGARWRVGVALRGWYAPGGRGWTLVGGTTTSWRIALGGPHNTVQVVTT